MKQITPHLYQLNLGFVNAFLIGDIVPSPDPADGLAPGLTLVDTGTPGNPSGEFHPAQVLPAKTLWRCPSYYHYPSPYRPLRECGCHQQ